jgi:N-terminal TM domain of oligopeptide transport permease C
MSIQASEILVETTHVDEEHGGSVRVEAWRRLRRNPAAIAGAALVLLFLLVAAFAPLLAQPIRSPSSRSGLAPFPARPPTMSLVWTTSAATSCPGCCSGPGSR